MKNIFFSCLAVLFLFGCDKTSGDSKTSLNATGQGGSLARFTIVGNYLYTVDKQNLKVYDLSNAAKPLFQRSVAVGFEIETIYPFKDKLFIGSTSQVHIFSIDDPANPKQLSVAISPNVIRRCDPVVAKDTVAYATLRSNGPCGGITSVLAVYNIKNIANPVQQTTIPVSEPYGLGYADSTLYVCDKNQGLMVFNITQAYNPVLVRSLTDGSYVDVIPYNNILVCWVTGGVILYDITNRRNPVLITKIS